MILYERNTILHVYIELMLNHMTVISIDHYGYPLHIAMRNYLVLLHVLSQLTKDNFSCFCMKLDA